MNDEEEEEGGEVVKGDEEKGEKDKEELERTCSQCSKVFPRKFNRVRHEQTVHKLATNKTKSKSERDKGEQIFQCDECPKRFAHERSMLAHKETAHPIKKTKSKRRPSPERVKLKKDQELEDIISTVNCSYIKYRLLNKYQVFSEGLYPGVVRMNGKKETIKTCESNLRELLADARCHGQSEISLPRFLSKYHSQVFSLDVDLVS